MDFQVASMLYAYSILYCIAFVLSFYVLKGRNSFSRSSLQIFKLVFIFLILLMPVIYNADSDFYDYKEWFYTGKLDNVEKIYYLFRRLSFGCYPFFRLIVWGGAFFFFDRLCSLTKVDKLIAYTIFAVFYMRFFAYARASFAIIIAIYAFNYICTIHHNFNFLKVLFALCLVALSIISHKSVLFLWAILLVSFLIRFNWKSLFFLLVIFPILAFLFKEYFEQSLSYLSFFQGAIGERIDSTTELTDEVIDEMIYNSLFSLLYTFQFFVLFIFSVVQLLLFRRKHRFIENVHNFSLIKRNCCAAVMILYVSFLFITSDYGQLLFLRYSYMSFPCIIVVSTYCITLFRKRWKLFFAIYCLQFLTSLYSLLLLMRGLDDFIKLISTTY